LSDSRVRLEGHPACLGTNLSVTAFQAGRPLCAAVGATGARIETHTSQEGKDDFNSLAVGFVARLWLGSQVGRVVKRRLCSARVYPYLYPWAKPKIKSIDK